MNEKHTSIVTVVIACYIAAQIFADVTAVRVIDFYGFSVDGGTFIYPLTFTLRDLVHKVTDKRTTRTLIFSAAGINLFMAGFFWLIAYLPADMHVGAQQEFGMVLAPVTRIVIASIIAEVFSELVDTEIYSLWVAKFGKSVQWMRVLSSNSISVPIDSVLFVSIAFIGVFPASVVWGILLTNIMIKWIMTVLSIPLIYLIPQGKAEQRLIRWGVETA